MIASTGARATTSTKAERQDLAQVLRRGSALEREQGVVVPCLAELDRHLPAGGVEAGSLVEVLGAPGAGALRLALRLAAGLQARSRDRTVVIVDPLDPTGLALYPPALAQAGLDLTRLVLLRPRGADALPCLDEVLRSSAVSAAVARVPLLPPTASHRLRQAAGQGGGVGVLVRPDTARGEVSAAGLRLLVREGGAPDRPLVVEPLRARGVAVPAPGWRIDAWRRGA